MTKGGRGAGADPREKVEPPRLAETEILAGPTRELSEHAQMIVSCGGQMFGEFTIGAVSTDVDPFISYRLSRLYGLLFAFVSRKRIPIWAAMKMTRLSRSTGRGPAEAATGRKQWRVPGA